MKMNSVDFWGVVTAKLSRLATEMMTEKDTRYKYVRRIVGFTTYYMTAQQLTDAAVDCENPSIAYRLDELENWLAGAATEHEAMKAYLGVTIRRLQYLAMLASHPIQTNVCSVCGAAFTDDAPCPLCGAEPFHKDFDYLL